MNIRTTVVLLLIAVAVGFFVVRESGKEPEPDKGAQAARQMQVFVDAVESDFTRLVLEKDGRTVELERGEGGAWRLRKPADMPADRTAATSCVSSLVTLWKKAEFDAPGNTPKDLEPYGLDKPRAVVQVTAKGKTTTLEVGSEGSTPETVFIRIDKGRKIAAVVGAIGAIADRTADEFVEKKPLRLDTTKVTRLEWTKGDAALTAVREGLHWTLEKPVQDRADDASLGGLLTALIDLSVTGLAPAGSDESKAGLSPPAVSLALTVEGGKEPRTLAIGAAVPDQPEKVFVRVGGLPVLLVADKSILERTALSANSYRLRRFFDYTAEGVQKMEFAGGAGAGACERKGDGWAVPGRESLAAHPTGVMKVIDALRGLAVQQFVDDAPKDLAAYGLAAPRLTLTLTPTPLPSGDATGPVPPAPPVQFLLGGPPPGAADLLCLKRADKPFVVGVPRKWADWLEQGVFNCVDPSMFAPSKAEIAGITLEKPPHKIVLTHDAARDAWTVAEPKDRSLDPGMWNVVLNALTGVESRGIVAVDAKDLIPWTLDKPALRIVVERKAPDEKTPAPPPMALRVSSPDGEGRIYGHVEGSGRVFILDKGVVDTLHIEPLSPLPDSKSGAPAGPPAPPGPTGPLPPAPPDTPH